MIADDPIGQNLSEIDLFADMAGVTDNISQVINYEGDYLALPVITVTYNQVTPIDRPINIEIGNASQSYTLKISQALAAGSTLTIDCVNDEVLLGTTVIRPRNPHPAFFQAGQLFTYSDDAATKNIDISARYYPRWL